MASESKAQLASLVELARQHTSDGRRVIFENITDLFLSPEGRLSERETALMTDILHKLIHDVEMEVRRDLSERLAENSDAPHNLVVMLANDEIEVARPILLRCGVLRDTDLIEVIKERTQEHILQVARRDTLSEAVTDAIVSRGEDDVIETLINNDDAVMSRRALQFLVERSKRVDRFQRPLILRRDLPPALAHRMFWWVSAALRQHILTSFAVDDTLVEDFLRDSAEIAIERTKIHHGAETAAEALVNGLADRGELTLDFILRALHNGEIQLFITALANRARVEIPTARRIVLDAGGEPLAVLCRAVGMEQGQFATTYLLTRSPHGNALGTMVTPKVAELFGSLTREAAMAALRYWKQDDEFLRAQSSIARVSSRTGA
ncbi:MAG TPA: DUF2336 domain-containing protein [Alphaproteobacteria bacterium]|nr:DUF2336 domain-containing protein [Alphaproteobacteria bacterium]